MMISDLAGRAYVRWQAPSGAVGVSGEEATIIASCCSASGMDALATIKHR
jgi:hypothetical protein